MSWGADWSVPMRWTWWSVTEFLLVIAAAKMRTDLGQGAEKYGESILPLAGHGDGAVKAVLNYMSGNTSICPSHHLCPS